MNIPTQFSVEQVLKVDYDSARMDVKLPGEKTSSVRTMFFSIITINTGHTFRHLRLFVSEAEVSALTDKIYTHVMVEKQPVNMEHWTYFQFSSADASPVLQAYIKSLESEVAA